VAAVPVGPLPHGFDLRLAPTVDLEGGEPLQKVEELPRQLGQRRPLAVHVRLGGEPDEGEEDRDERQHRGQDQQ
jgi:hypothetical protein